MPARTRPCGTVEMIRARWVARAFISRDWRSERRCARCASPCSTDSSPIADPSLLRLDLLDRRRHRLGVRDGHHVADVDLTESGGVPRRDGEVGAVVALEGRHTLRLVEGGDGRLVMRQATG